MIKHTFKPELNLVIWTLSGNVTAENVISYLKKVVNSEGYVAGMSTLADHRSVKSEFTIEDFMSISLETKFIYGKLGKKVRCATVFDKDVQMAMGQVYTAYSEDTPVDFYPCTSMDEAIEWLGLTGKLKLN